MTISLRPLEEADLQFVSEVRNHPETLRYLHDQRAFPLEQTQAWFRQTKPEWWIILSDGRRVGYFRSSDHDDRNGNIKIGADVHPDFRRRGFAKAAYPLLMRQLAEAGWVRVWLEVLPDNAPAISLYRQLGFHDEGMLRGSVKRGNARENSLIMGRLLCPDTGRNAKVVAVYLGPRRQHPANSQESYELLAYLIDRELSLDPGCHCDTILVHNREESSATLRSDLWRKRCEDLLTSIDGAATPGGRIQLVTRENMGISFGAYHHAFEAFFDRYDHWLFIEDDQVVIRSGCFGQAIEQMRSDRRIGFVALVGISTETDLPPHAHGGVGVSSRSVLREVRRANPSNHHALGHLPYHWEQGYANQEHLGEIRFTNAIHQLDYRLVNHDWDEICVSWMAPGRRTSRLVRWNPLMSQCDRFVDW